MATGGLFSFQRVLESFKSQLWPSLAAEFEMTSLADLKRSIAKIERKQATERRLQNMGRLANFVDIMDNYGKVTYVFLNVTDVLAFVWALESMFHDILEFHQTALTYFRKPNVMTDQDTLTRARSGNPQAGIWLLRHELFRSWKERNTNPILWVNGIPGAGKTVLASIMIDDCLKIQSKCTIWFYFKNGDTQKKSFLSFASSVISQLLEKNTDLLPYVHRETCRKGKRTLFSETLAKELLELMIRNSGKVCIVVDGLDECSKVERRKVIEWMRLVIEPSQHSNSDYIQCVFISQRDGITAKALRDVPSLQINTKNTHDDIFAFVSSRGLDIKNKFHLSDETIQSIAQLVMEKAGGMFLLAKLVMNNLFSQISPAALFKEYERILNNILVEHSLRTHALQLLAWLVCAKRQLWWREVQGAVSIDLETEDVDPESRQWILDSRDICDSLVEVRTDGSLELVHTTAKLFLVQSKLVDVRREELNMARLCVGYLALPGFEISQPDESILVLINHGYYAFLDYAACFWSTHLQEGLKYSIDRETAVLMVEVLSKFLESHYRSSEKEINIPFSARGLERRLQEHEVWSASGQFLNAFVSTQNQLCCFSEDATSNDSLDIPCVIARIRELLERMASGNQDDTKVEPKDEL
ncbi:hypothetical protein N7491_005878 [Penicillium cf. griseofulvum]|uniref:NACHT domain-containing protein n=1 Tax=Penicillium cf. griseofulvum TaxID=2972120 RepID=A0A9W9M5E4_9EURO|nr:hypothetical protein N7472_008562 [Penicillium cf. griseofulvum]KAJ5435283.1 hypothetical protein N7491_005878 [Penicillium cf. griseofulvum]KAJ5453116.1 hypothetical protein N7445_001299 [Penicillium cf. griseofulvum]